MIRAIPFLLVFFAGGLIGGLGGSRIATRTAEAMIIPCPACNCPPAAVLHLAPDFDVSKINNRKGTFEYSPKTEFQGAITVVIECKDSVLLKQMLKAAK